MSHSKYLYYHLSRRDFIRTAAAGVMIVGAPGIMTGVTRRARAGSTDTIRILFTASTFMLEDWSVFERETGLRIEATVIKDDPGLFLNEIMVNDGGERYDIITAQAGAERPLISGGYILPMEVGRLRNWAGISADIREMPYLKSENGKHWGVPLAMNADSFGYFPARLDEPRPPEEVSWSLIFDSEKTHGRSSTGDNYIYLQEAAAYLKVKGMAEIADPANMTPDEAKIAADFMIERKRAGQFRNFWSTYDAQLADILNGEVLAIRCWEPAVREARKQGLDMAYAYAQEFYDKWMHACYIPSQVKNRDKVDQVYAALDWIIGGSYAAHITSLRGYVTARPDLGIAYAKDHDLGDAVVASLEDAQEKVGKKFAKSLFWFRAVPDHFQDIVAQMNRVMAA